MKNEKLRLLAPAVILLAFALVMLVPKYFEGKAADAFGAPLFEHALPANTEVIEQDAAKTDDGGMMAAMLLKTDLTSEELEAFYADVDAQPAEEGDVVTLSAKALDESSLEALQKAKLYEEDAQYQFVYLYSAPPEE